MCVCVLHSLCLADRKVLSGFVLRSEVRLTVDLAQMRVCRATGISGLRGFLEMLLVGHGASWRAP